VGTVYMTEPQGPYQLPGIYQVPRSKAKEIHTKGMRKEANIERKRENKKRSSVMYELADFPHIFVAGRLRDLMNRQYD
jgi:hypothetical protein